MALRENGDASLPLRRRIAALKEENKVLRVKAGWEAMEDDSDDEQRMDEKANDPPAQVG